MLESGRIKFRFSIRFILDLILMLQVGRIKSGTVESLRFMNNKIWIIDDDLFE